MPDISILSRNNTVYIVFIVYIELDILGFMKKSDDTAQILLGRRIRSLRNVKGWTQEALGAAAGINYKFLGEIERGQQNPSFNVLIKIANALDMEPHLLFQFEHEISDRKEIEIQLDEILKSLPDNTLHQVLMILNTLFPVH